MDWLKNILDSAKTFLTNDLDFLSLGEGLAPAIYIVAFCVVAIVISFLIALIVSAKGKANKFKQSLDDTTAFVNANGIVDEENVEPLYQKIKTMPESVNEGWGQFMDQQTGNPSDYLTAREILGERKKNPEYASGSKFFRLISSIIILLGILLAAISCVEPLFNLEGKEVPLVLAQFVLPVVGTMAFPWIVYLILNAILSGVNKSKYNKLQNSFSAFQDALDSNVIIFKEVQDEFITENIEEINAAIEDILANKLMDSEILEIVTTPKVSLDYAFEEDLPEDFEEVAPIEPKEEEVEKVVAAPPADTRGTAITEEINKGERLVQLVYLADRASRDPDITEDTLKELVVYLETVRTSGEYEDEDEQAVFVDCLIMLAGAYQLRFA